MIAFIRGMVVDTGGESVLVDVNGLGFEIIIPVRTLQQIPVPGREVFLHTYLQVLENEFKLYGFLEKGELTLFRTLMGISGMGARTCLGVVSAMTPEELYRAVLAEDEKTLTKIPGIGKKSAQRLIFELKGKVPQVMPEKAAGNTASPTWQETLIALETLGYSRSEVFPILVELQAQNELADRVEENIKRVLRIKAASLKT